MPYLARVALSASLLTAACGEPETTTASSPSSDPGTGDASSSGPTTDTPTSGEPASSTSGASNSGSESGSSSSDGTGTTAQVDPGTTSSTTSDDTTSGSTSGSTSSDDTTSGSTSSDDTTSGSTSSDDTTSGTTSSDDTGTPNMCGAPSFPDKGVPPAFTGCASQKAESRWCMMLGGGNNVTVLGLDTQTSCVLTQLQTNAIEIFAVGSIGVIGGDLFTCTSQFGGTVVRVSLQTGAVEQSATPCAIVSEWRGNILVEPEFPSGEIQIYPDWAAVTQAAPVWQFQPQGIFNETLSAQNDILYAGWHSDNHVDRFQLPCGEPLGPVAFANFDDWMQGIAVSSDDRFHTHGFSYNGVRSFDAMTGADVMAWPAVPVDGVGLACFVD